MNMNCQSFHETIYRVRSEIVERQGSFGSTLCLPVIITDTYVLVEMSWHTRIPIGLIYKTYQLFGMKYPEIFLLLCPWLLWNSPLSFLSSPLSLLHFLSVPPQSLSSSKPMPLVLRRVWLLYLQGTSVVISDRQWTMVRELFYRLSSLVFFIRSFVEKEKFGRQLSLPTYLFVEVSCFSYKCCDMSWPYVLVFICFYYRYSYLNICSFIRDWLHLFL